MTAATGTPHPRTPADDLPFTAPHHDSGAAAFDKAHNIEYGRQHNGYSHMGIPPECPACLAGGRDAADGDAT